MREEMAQREAAELRRGGRRPRSPHGWGLLAALWLLAFYQPVVTEGHLRRKNLEFIFIRFSAWEFAGCDKLWAGLVTTLCHRVRRHFGALPLSVFHVLGSRPRFAAGASRREWVLKRGACLRLGGLLLVLAVGVAVLLVALLVPGVKDHRALKVVGGAVASLSGSSLVLGALSILKNFLVSEKKKIERLTNSDRFAGQLGFMSKIRAEVEVLVDYLAFMEVFERRRLRVVMEITSLHLCYPEKVAGVFNAMATLLSDANAPFIFLLAVDPSVIVPCLEQAGCMKGLADNGYLYLNRAVTLPFSIPEMGARSRLRSVAAAIRTREDLMALIIAGNAAKTNRGAGALPAAAPASPGWKEADSEAVVWIHEAFRCLHDGTDVLCRYLPENGANVRRIVNTIPITLRLLLHRAGGAAPLSPRAAAAWVVLADRWPCRLSWTLRCLEDAGPSAAAAASTPAAGRSLWSIFEEHAGELSALRQPLGKVLSLDGDPGLFQAFLARDFPFGADEARQLLGVTVNLDHSIRQQMGLLRALARLGRAAPPNSRFSWLWIGAGWDFRDLTALGRARSRFPVSLRARLRQRPGEIRLQPVGKRRIPGGAPARNSLGGAGPARPQFGNGAGSDGNGSKSIGNRHGSDGNGAGSIGNRHGSDGNGAGSIGNGSKSIGNRHGSTGNGAGSIGNRHGSTGNGAGSIGNGAGSIGNRHGSTGNGAGSIGNGAGSIGNRHGTTGNGAGSDRNNPGSIGNNPRSTGNGPGSIGNNPGSIGNGAGSNRNGARSTGNNCKSIGNNPRSTRNNPRSTRNSPGSDRNGAGSIGNNPRSNRKGPRSIRNGPGSDGNNSGSIGNGARSDGNSTGSDGNGAGSIGNNPGSNGNDSKSIGNSPRSNGNGTGSIGNSPGSIRNGPRSNGNSTGSIGNGAGSIGNGAGSIGNGAGSIGNGTGSNGNGSKSIGNSPRSNGNSAGSNRDCPRSFGNSCGSIGNGGGSDGNNPGSIGNGAGSIGNCPRSIGNGAGSTRNDPRSFRNGLKSIGNGSRSFRNDPRSIGNGLKSIGNGSGSFRSSSRSTRNSSRSIGNNPRFLGNNPGFLGNGSGFLGNNPGFLGNGSGFLGNNPGFLGNNPGFLGNNPGFLGN
ncbi:NTPase KAP family P-loop domain-containing protein 1, partial [Lonchura striata]